MQRHRIALLASLLALLATAAMADHESGVTLYRDAHFRGSSQVFFGGAEIPALGRLTIGNDSISSVKVDQGCRVALYKDVSFRGVSVILTEDVADLGSTYVGNDAVSSIKVECRRPGWFGSGGSRRPGYYDGDRHGGHQGRYPDERYDWRGRRGVILYSDDDFGGRQEAFYADDPSLKDNPIRQDSVSSVRVAPGCRVVLYGDVDYRGRSALLTESTRSLQGSKVGNDRTSSLEIACGGRSDGVTLYQHIDYEGKNETFLRDDPQLRDNFIRQDGVSSAQVAPGCVVTLYEHPGYRGRATTLRQDTPDLRATRVGNDTISSIRVDCRRRNRRW